MVSWDGTKSSYSPDYATNKLIEWGRIAFRSRWGGRRHRSRLVVPMEAICTANVAMIRGATHYGMLYRY